MMKQNVGTVDRLLRIVVGFGLISLVFVGPQTPLGWIGVVPVLTALIGYCPAYTLFGFKTCKNEKMGGSCCGGSCHNDAPKDESKPAA